MLDIFMIILVSIILMLISSDIIVRTIVEFSKKADFPPYLITFFSISLGSSLPEMINSIVLSINNLAGAAFFNILNNLVIDFTLVLGLGFMLHRSSDISIDKNYVYVMVFAFIVFLFSVIDGYISKLEGIALFLAYIFSSAYLIFIHREKLIARKTLGLSLKDTLRYSFLTSAAVFVLIVNANIVYALVHILIAFFKIKEHIIGFLLGFFTILPELLVTLVSYFSLKRADIAIFNLFGTFMTDLTLGIGVPAAIVGLSLVDNMFLVYTAVFVLYLVMVIADLIVIKGKLPKDVGLLLFGAYLLYVFTYLYV